MPEILGLGGIGGNLVSQATGLLNVFLAIFGFVVVGGGVFLIITLLNKFIFSYKTPVELKFEVGDNIIHKRDKMKVVSKNGQYDVKFKKYNKLVAEVPHDGYAHITKSGRNPSKGFEGFVRDDQVAWVPPRPVVGAVKEMRTYVDPDSGEQKQLEVEVPSLITAPANLLRYHVDRNRRNAEIARKLKWWQNPTIIGAAMVGAWVISIVFMYIMHKSVVEEAKMAIQMAQSIAESSVAQVVP